MNTAPRIRTNAHPVILTGSRASRHRADDARHSRLIDVARDLHSGDTRDWAYELLLCSQMLRLAYDSPRIGGGIDPAVATNLPGWDDLVTEGGMFAYIVGDPDADPTNTLQGLTAEQIQDQAVHAEAVALALLALTDGDER